MIQGYIFDLDNCIFETASMGESLLDPIIKAASDSDFGKQFGQKDLEKIRQDLWIYSLEDAAAINNIPTDIFRAMRLAYGQLEAPDWSRVYPDAVPEIRKLKGLKILVTTGHKKFQLSKIKVTGIRGLFDEIIIDSTDDRKSIKGKKKIFAEIINNRSWPPAEVVVLGDNPNSELKAGKELGMITIQTLRPGVKKQSGFDFYIKDFCELEKIIKEINK